MFIRSGGKKDVIAAETMEPGQGVGNSRAVRVADMQFGTRIINQVVIKYFFFSVMEIPPLPANEPALCT